MLNTGWGKKNKGRAEGVAGRGEGWTQALEKLDPPLPRPVPQFPCAPRKALWGWAMPVERGQGVTAVPRERGAAGEGAPPAFGANVPPPPAVCPRPPTPRVSPSLGTHGHPRPRVPHQLRPKAAVTPRQGPRARQKVTAPGTRCHLAAPSVPVPGGGAGILHRDCASWIVSPRPLRALGTPCPPCPPALRASPGRATGTSPQRRRGSVVAPVWPCR